MADRQPLIHTPRCESFMSAVENIRDAEPDPSGGDLLDRFSLRMVDTEADRYVMDGLSTCTCGGNRGPGKTYDHDARPDDLPEPGERCRECGEPIFWSGPDLYNDWTHVDDKDNR